jgi:hypothetical protein
MRPPTPDPALPRRMTGIAFGVSFGHVSGYSKRFAIQYGKWKTPQAEQKPVFGSTAGRSGGNVGLVRGEYLTRMGIKENSRKSSMRTIVVEMCDLEIRHAERRKTLAYL